MIGWREAIALPEWGIERLPAKIDTGARTSALHVTSIRVVGTVRALDGSVGDLLEIVIPLSRRHLDRTARIRTPQVGWRRVRSSNGLHAERPVVRTRFHLGGVERDIDLTLTDRSLMQFRVLLGRQALAGCFVVDVHQEFCQGPRARKRKRLA